LRYGSVRLEPIEKKFLQAGIIRGDFCARLGCGAAWRIRAPVSPISVLCYAFNMTAKKLKDVWQRVEAWPEAAQLELAELALEIDAELGLGEYKATAAELKGIDRGLDAALKGRFSTADQVEALFKKHRPA
jgi:hypothetical protein